MKSVLQVEIALWHEVCSSLPDRLKSIESTDLFKRQPVPVRQGTIKKLVHLSGQTDIPSANIVRDHNFHGYGYIETPEGDEFYFDHAAVTGLGFDRLSEGDPVKFALDESEPQQAKSVVMAG